jgi:type IV secretory pathway TrbD component
VDLERGVDEMTVHKMLQAPEREVLLVSALLATLVSLAFTDWGVLAYVLTGLVFGAVLLASAVANARQRRATHR